MAGFFVIEITLSWGAAGISVQSSDPVLRPPKMVFLSAKASNRQRGLVSKQAIVYAIARYSSWYLLIADDPCHTLVSLGMTHVA